ncbi:hypothetical protein Pst134EA_024414 [Puccinia striiformis f. sp. tritici]|uniref:hypothetical protein n=1 Tax=Puccinia striiformis f. sp. tritici TaxID=168172 RepID=UPI002007C8A7|nr:hypothetical protein Pst134EA_024414 [Puccinia striiformis f. sp. tritici]KAH9453544.1 hypothetical protein Pst134EA_024414 [Puccinia striiformis f. sp. tritici]
MLVVITTLSVFLSCITQSLAWHYSGPNFVKTGHFQMGQSNVTFCYPRITPAGLTILTPAARVESLTPVSLTPIRCDRFECHPATSSPPELASCKIVAQTLLNNFTGTVTLPPKTFVVVSHKNCAAILQNHDKEHDYPLQFTWTQVGLESLKIMEKCVLPHTGLKGGLCMFDSYMGYNFSNPALELQSWSDEANFLESHQSKFHIT